MTVRRGLLIAAIVPLLLAGCTAPSSIARSTYAGVPQGVAEELNLFNAEPIAIFAHGGTVLAIITVGSAECPPVPTSMSMTDATTIDLTFMKSPNTPCGTQLSPTTHEFAVPDGLDTAADVKVSVLFDYEDDVTYDLITKG